MENTTSAHWVVAVDGEKWSLRALAHALFLAASRDKVTCIFIGEETERSIEFMDKALAIKDKMVKKIKTRFLAAPHLHSDFIPLEEGKRTTDSIGKAICEYVTRTKAKYLVTGSRGLGVFASALKGSVSQYCLANAPCPVLVVRKKSSVKSTRKTADTVSEARFVEGSYIERIMLW